MSGVIAFFAGPLGRWLAIALMLASFGGFCFVKGIHHEEAKEAKRVIAQQKADLKAMAQAAEKTKSLQRAKDEAINAANERAKTSEAAASAAHAVGDGLRDDLARAQRDVSRAADDAVRKYAATVSAVFGECSAEVERLARAAQGHASDSLMYQQSWPK